MSSRSHHSGIVVPLVTPVTADGTLDEAAAERLVSHVAAGGCGLLLLGTTGEVASLSGSLRRRYVEIAVRVAKGRVPVFACVAHNCFDDAVELARAHLEQGVDAIVGMLPNYFKLGAPEMRRYFELLADRTPGPLFLYNMPATTGMSLPIEVVEALSQRANIVGMKDSEQSPGRREAVAERLGGRDDFSLFMGVAAHAVAALKLGFHGVVPSSGNLQPELWRDLFAAARAGDWPRAESLQQRALTLGAIFQGTRTLGESLAALKAGLATQHLCGPDMLPPLAALSSNEQTACAEQLAHFK
jgi:4-hydroxy-tetrahydrodipicolinate synthase